MINLSDGLCEVMGSPQIVCGPTHRFYRYPARFSPLFVWEAVEQFSLAAYWFFDLVIGAVR